MEFKALHDPLIQKRGLPIRSIRMLNFWKDLTKEEHHGRQSNKKHLLGLKLTLILFLFCIQVNANGYGQGITISVKNETLDKIFEAIENQTTYTFVFDKTQLTQAKKISLTVSNSTLAYVLERCFAEQPLTYEIVDRNIVIKDKKSKKIDNNSSLTSSPIIKRTVSGRIIGEKGEPLAGATITVRRSNLNTISNENGYFTLSEVEENAVLVVSSVGYVTQQVRLNNNESFEIRLPIAIKEEEEVVVAYNKVSSRSNTGAVTVVKGEQIQSLPNRSFDKSLQGLVPGLLVTQGSGLPGSGVANFVLRGIATAADPSFGSTVRNPLIVIDGVPVSQDQFQIAFNGSFRTSITNPLAQLNPSDIESISVLKDASAIALYGSRASNGVIVVTTKKGKAGKTHFNFRSQTDIGSLFKGETEPLSQQEYLELLFESYRNLNSPLYPNDAAIYADLRKKFPVIVNAPGDTSFYPEQDWYGELFRKNALTTSNEISMTGGNDKNNYYLNLEYTKQDGIVKATDYDRKSLRFNFENRPTTWLKLGLNSTASYNVQNYGTAIRGFNGSVANNMSPLNPVRYTNGSYVLNYLAGGGPQSSSQYPNPAAAAEFNINRNTAFRGLSNLNVEISFLKYFKFNSIGGFDFMLAESKEKADPRFVDPGSFDAGINVGRIEENNIRRANLISSNMLRYIRTIGQYHSINILVGQEAQVQTQKQTLIAVKNLALPYYDQINSPGVLPLRQSAINSKETLLSYFGQINYGFNNKYFISTSIRRDGSSRFGEDKRFGTYWSAGSGWVITGEDFMKGTSSWINYLKLRGSLGAAGNAGAINAATKFDQLQNLSYSGGTAVMARDIPGNPDVRWEQTYTWDAGLEARLWDERISLTADVYQRNTKDLIYPVNLPASTGYVNVLQNIGKMENRGVELSLSAYVIRKRNFTWIIDANWSTNKNKLVKANVSTASLYAGVLVNQEGENFNSFYMPLWAGVNPSNGDPQWLDSAGNTFSKYPNALKDKKIVGKSQPDGFGSFSTRLVFKAVELSAMFYYQYGYKIYVESDGVSDGAFPYMNQDRKALDRWQKPGDMATNPKRILNNRNGYSTNSPSTRYLFDGDHIRLQNVTIAWNIPKAFIERIHMTGIKLFVQGNNLAVWTKYPDTDPNLVQVNGTTGSNSFPSGRTFSFGINANF